MPVKTGIHLVHSNSGIRRWIPACAGMTDQKIAFKPIPT